MTHKFVYFEPPVNRKVRNSRNDLRAGFGDNSDMPKPKTPDQRWYVKEWLEFKNLRQKDLVARTDWNKSQINEWVNEKERWNRDVLFAFAHAIGVEPADLLRRPPRAPIDDEFYLFVQRLDEKDKARLLRLWNAANDEAA